MPLYNIHNPTVARRVIYDGSLQQIKITIEAGQTKHGVEIQPHIAAGFSNGQDGRKDDLWLIPVGSPPPIHAPVPSHATPAPEQPAAVEAAPQPQPIPEEGLPPPPPMMPAGYRRYQAPAIEDPVEKAIAAEAEADELVADEAPLPERRTSRRRPASKRKAAASRRHA